MALFQIYQMGLLRKAAAIEEAYLRQLPSGDFHNKEYLATRKLGG
jgi:hypothetical protein